MFCCRGSTASGAKLSCCRDCGGSAAGWALSRRRAHSSKKFGRACPEGSTQPRGACHRVSLRVTFPQVAPNRGHLEISGPFPNQENVSLRVTSCRLAGGRANFHEVFHAHAPSIRSYQAPFNRALLLTPFHSALRQYM